MRPLRAVAIVAVLLAGGAWPLAGPAGPVCAAEEPRAGLVVDTGARVLTFCVRLDAREVTGLHLIELAAEQHGLTYGFGLGGAAVCRLAGVGSEGSDCFGEYPSFWGYWHGDGVGGWSWASAGAGSHRLEDGDVDGWVWGEGDTPATHEHPPATAFDDLCRSAAPEPTPTRSPSEPAPSPPAGSGDGGGTDGATGTSSGTQPVGPSDGGATSSPGSTGPEGTSSPPTPRSATSVVTTSLEAAGAGSSPGGGGPPAGLLIAGALGAALVVGSVLRMRTKPGERP